MSTCCCCPQALAITVILVLLTSMCQAGLNEAQCRNPPTNPEERFKDCAINFTVLEKALYETCDNRFELISKFYPARETVTQYAKVTYVFLNSTKDNQTWIWTMGSFFYVQPPAVLRFTSLLFVYPEDNIKNLTLYLPKECKAASKVRRNGDEGKLEILTRRLKLYAKFNSLDDVSVEDYADGFATAIDEDHLYSIYDEVNKSYNSNVIVSLTMVIHIFLIPSFFLALKGSRIHLRSAFNNPTWYPSFAANVAIGLLFSTFVVILDSCAIVWSFDMHVDNELRDTFHDINKNKSLDSVPSIRCLIGTLVIDALAWLFGVFCILVALCQAFKCCSCPCLNSCLLSCTLCLWPRGSNTEDFKNEFRLWWLCTSFLGPLVCLGSHIFYVIAGWLSDPHRGGGIFIVYVITYLFLIIALRIVYNAFSDKAILKAENEHIEMVEYGEELRMHTTAQPEVSFSFISFFAVLVIGFILAGVELYIAAAYSFAPIVGAIKDPPQYILTVFEVAVVLASLLLTYRFFFEEPPVDRELLVSMIQNIRYYKKHPGGVPDGAKDVPFRGTEIAKAGAALGATVYNHLNSGDVAIDMDKIKVFSDEGKPDSGCCNYKSCSNSCKSCLESLVAAYPWCRKCCKQPKNYDTLNEETGSETGAEDPPAETTNNAAPDPPNVHGEPEEGHR